jgi:MazG family protein
MIKNNSLEKVALLYEWLKKSRDPNTGCAWSAEQNFKTIAPYTLQEIYELIEAIETDDVAAIQDELGDLLFHILFYAQIAEEKFGFDLNDIAEMAINKQQRRRHSEAKQEGTTLSASDVHALWQKNKMKEKETKSESILAGISSAMTALLRAKRLQEAAATVGFDWASPEPIFDKITEEITELKTAMADKSDLNTLTGEMGDILFCCVNLARVLGIDPEAALRQTNRKFTQRFHYIEKTCHKNNKTLSETSLVEMEVLWEEAKKSGTR